MRGEALLAARDYDIDLGGMVRACERNAVEIVPILFAGTQPSGTIAAEAYTALKSEILDTLADRLPVDGVVLALHGAGVADGAEDLEGDLAGALRDLIGEGVPMVATFDLHGNVSQTMADALDGVFACHHYPHVDMHERGEEAVGLVLRMLDEGFRPVTHVETLPMLLPTTTTFKGIGQSTLNTVLALENDGEVIDVSWFHGFPYADTALVGTHLAVTTTGNREAAARVAKVMAEKLWDTREAFRPQSLSPEQALEQALALEGEPIVVNETSDNCGGGSPGDGTHLLRAMLAAQLERACFGFIVDPITALQAHNAGVGASIDVSLGGRHDDIHGEPIQAQAYVKALHDGDLVFRAMMKGAPMHLGPMARLVISGIDVVVASNRSQTFDIGPFLAVGIDVSDYKIVALKSSNHFRAGFQDIAAGIVTADPPGLTTHQISVFPRRNATRPMWPIDEAASYD